MLKKLLHRLTLPTGFWVRIPAGIRERVASRLMNHIFMGVPIPALAAFTRFQQGKVADKLALALAALAISFLCGGAMIYPKWQRSHAKAEAAATRLREERRGGDSARKAAIAKDRELKSFRRSAQYKRFNAYLESGVVIPGEVPEKDLDLLLSKAEKYQIPPSILWRLCYVESRFKADAVSSRGAVNYMQVMPSIYRHYAGKLGLSKEMSRANVTEVACHILHELYSKYRVPGVDEQKAWQKALVAYNIGPNKAPSRKAKHYASFILKNSLTLK